MRELVTIGVGNFGIKTTDNIMQSMAEEHRLNQGDPNSTIVENSYPEIFFDEIQSGKWLARGLLVDADCTTIDQVRTGSGGSLYGLENFTCGKTSFSSVFAKARYGEGSDISLAAMEKVRCLLERCDSPQGFMVSYGLGGGAGSGMGLNMV
jgi:tubulin alpha